MPKPALQVIQPVQEAASQRDIVTRWGGDPAIMASGYVAVPLEFLKHYAKRTPYCLSQAEAIFVIQVMAFKWDAKAPFPGYKTIAARMGVSPQYARKLARALEGKGLLRRITRVGSSNAYDLRPLFATVVARAKPRLTTEPTPEPEGVNGQGVRGVQPKRVRKQSRRGRRLGGTVTGTASTGAARAVVAR